MASPYAKNGKIRPHNTTIVDNADKVVVTLYNTVIFEWDRKNTHCHVSTGGYNTPTTIRRINECLKFYDFAQRVCKADFKNRNSFVILNPF